MNKTAIVSRRDLIAALPHLRRYAEVLMGRTTEAEDLVADTLERVRWQSSAEPAGTPGRTKLFGLMHELYAGHAAASDMKRTAVAFDAAAVRALPARSSELLAQFGELSTEEREVLLLVAVEGMRYEEIAELLQVPLSTVMARLKRARDLLRCGRF